MLTVPPETPYTVASNVEGINVAMAVELDDQVPPGIPSFKVMLVPSQSESGPVTGAGGSCTCRNFVFLQPVRVIVYSIAEKPVFTPYTRPDASTVATRLVALYQVPSGVTSVSTVLRPLQTSPDPTMGAGRGLTVTT
jgi:hypothetical protein